MQVWAVIYDSTLFTEDLYQHGLLLVDPDSCTRIKRFYRRDDACRTLIGRLLPRMLLKEQGIPLSAMNFAATEAGKPYITTPGISPMGFNVSHDNALVAMAFAPGRHNPPAFSIGIDVMKVRIPGHESFPSFVETVGDQLTALEHHLLFSGVSQDENIRRFFWMWTIKEAYTKALGIGLGFDFSRVEYNVSEDILRVDGEIPKGWRFNKFEISESDDLYQGVVAEFVGGDETIFLSGPKHEWLRRFDATAFVERAIQDFKDT